MAIHFHLRGPSVAGGELLLENAAGTDDFKFLCNSERQPSTPDPSFFLRPQGVGQARSYGEGTSTLLGSSGVSWHVPRLEICFFVVGWKKQNLKKTVGKNMLLSNADPGSTWNVWNRKFAENSTWNVWRLLACDAEIPSQPQYRF